MRDYTTSHDKPIPDSGYTILLRLRYDRSQTAGPRLHHCPLPVGGFTFSVARKTETRQVSHCHISPTLQLSPWPFAWHAPNLSLPLGQIQHAVSDPHAVSEATQILCSCLLLSSLLRSFFRPHAFAWFPTFPYVLCPVFIGRTKYVAKKNHHFLLSKKRVHYLPKYA